MAVGIIAEYNPFHSGHAWQIREIRRRLGEDTSIVIAMSGNFVQRGDVAIMEKHLRAADAVRGGADLILGLPAAASLSSAEGFAAAGVKLLSATGVVDTLCYGTENADASSLRRIAEALASEDFPPLLQMELKRGISFAAAREKALAALIGEELAALSESPNNILAIAYETALLSSPLFSISLPRVGARHDGADTADGFASASYIREKLLAGEAADSFLTEASRETYRLEAAAGRAPVSLKNAERAVLARLRSMSEEDFAAYDEGGEGLYRRFCAAAHQARSIEELLEAVKTKRYAMARLRRMLLRAYLALPDAAEVPYLQVLAANSRGCALLKEMKQAATLPVLTKSAEARNFEGAARAVFEAECRCTDLYALCCPSLTDSQGDAEWRRSPTIV